MKRVPVKFLMVTGASIMLGSVLISTYMRTWWSFVAFYAVMQSIGIGIVYWVPIICSWEWFPDHKGLISGLIIGAFGFGSFFFSFISTALANPNNLSASVIEGSGNPDKFFPKEVADRVPHMLRICLICWAFLCFIAVSCVTRKPEFRNKPLSKASAKGTVVRSPKDVVTFKEAFTSWRFYHMTLLLFQGMFFGLYMASIYKVGVMGILSDKQLTIAGAIGSVCNGSFRLFWASLQDKIGFRKTYLCLMCVQLVVSCVFWSCCGNVYLYCLAVACSFLCLGGHFSMFPAAAVKIFGIVNGGQILSIMMFA